VGYHALVDAKNEAGKVASVKLGLECVLEQADQQSGGIGVNHHPTQNSGGTRPPVPTVIYADVWGRE